MSRRDDVSRLYALSLKLGDICKLLFWVNCALSVVSLFVAGRFFNVLSILQIASAVAFVAISLADDGLFWYDAEKERRKNNIQNAFAVRLSDLETDEYYNNLISPSMIKYALNTFEGNYFSKFIASKMLIKSAVKTLIAIILLISAGWVIGDGSILLIASQAVFSAYILEDTVLLAIYKGRLEKIYDIAYSEFITIGVSKKQQVVLLLYYCIEYESIKAHYKVKLDSKIFKKCNGELSDAWDKIVSNVNIDISTEETRI